MTDHIHTCSYYCDRPECIKRQRDELVKWYVEKGEPLFWKVQTPYGIAYRASDEFLEAFPDFPMPPEPIE
jgi:hypothetical protein